MVLPEDQDKVEDPTDSYEFMEAPSKANKVEEGSPNNQDASETTDEVVFVFYHVFGGINQLLGFAGTKPGECTQG